MAGARETWAGCPFLKPACSLASESVEKPGAGVLTLTGRALCYEHAGQLFVFRPGPQLASGQSPSCTALKIRPRSRRTCSSWHRQSTRSQAPPSNDGRPSGPFTEVSNLPISSGIYARFASKAHLPTSAPLRARASSSLSGQLYGHHPGGDPALRHSPCSGRTGAPCRDCSRWVSPARPPHPACDSHRTGRSTCLDRRSAGSGGCRFRGPRGRYVSAAVAVAGHRDAGCAGEHDPVVGETPSLITEATAHFCELLSIPVDQDLLGGCRDLRFSCGR